MIVRLWFLVDKRALVVTAVCIAAWRLLLEIPVTNLSPAFISTRLELYSGPGFFAAVGRQSIPFSAYSVGYEGIGPYVNGLVIVCLLGVISSTVRGMFTTHEGRLSLTRWARALALLLAMGQAYGWTVLAQNVGAVANLDWSGRLLICLELTGGTAVMILLAGVVDEFGLGFGYAAFLFYALRIVGDAAHRLADMLATNPSIDAALKALFWGSAWAVAACAVSVAVVLATRRMGDSAIPLIGSGVVRPVQFAYAMLFLPTIVANYYVSTNVYAVTWFVANWAPLGPSWWLDVIYIALEAGLMIAFAFFVAVVDRSVLGLDAPLRSVGGRLALIGGACIAVLVVVVPTAAELLDKRVSIFVPLGGFSLLLVVVMLLLVIRSIERLPLKLSSLIP